MMMKRIAPLLAAALLVPVALTTQAAEFPTKPVRLMVGANAGGGTDIIARMLAEKFAEAFTGFSMQAKVQRADQDASAARISGVPALAVDGRFLINNEAAGNYEDLLRITDSVVAKVRQERKGK
jgi:parvulin-like peptidyl-prolyl isomerase